MKKSLNLKTNDLYILAFVLFKIFYASTEAKKPEYQMPKFHYSQLLSADF